MKLGNVIKKIRINLDMSQEDLCKKTGINQAYLSQIENNLKIPSMVLLDRISIVYCVPVFALLILAAEDKDIDNVHLDKWLQNRATIYELIEDTFSFNE